MAPAALPWVPRASCLRSHASHAPLGAACREEEASEVHGHITSLAVARTHRKLGLATKLMSAAREWRGGGRAGGRPSSPVGSASPGVAPVGVAVVAVDMADMMRAASQRGVASAIPCCCPPRSCWRSSPAGA